MGIEKRMKSIAIILIMAFLFFGLMSGVGSYEAFADEGSIIRLNGDNRYETADEVSEYLLSERNGKLFNSVIIASGTSYPDALSASYLCRTLNCPLLLAGKGDQSDLVEQVQDLVAPEGTIYIVGGHSAVPKALDRAIKKAGFKTVERLAGRNKYETNAQVLKEGDKIVTKNGGKLQAKVLVCSGENYADALSAGATGFPILLTNGKLTGSQNKWIDGRAEKRFYIIGGKSAVPQVLEQTLKKKAATGRVYGNDRYATAVAVAKKFFSGKKECVVASGTNYPDGLSACRVAQLHRIPILLTSNIGVAASYNYEKETAMTKAFIVGGESAVSDKLVYVTGHAMKSGWNVVGSKFVYINKQGKVETTDFKYQKKRIIPTTGGTINAFQREFLKWPVEGALTSYFGRRYDVPSWASQNHGGIDIGVAYKNVRAAADGVVVSAKGMTRYSWYYGYGYTVILKHPDGFYTLYGHNSRVKVKIGQKVKAGDIIAVSGSTGRSTGPHLHFEMRVGNNFENGRKVDPLDFLPPNRYWKGR